MVDYDFSGRVAIVTGSATGIGYRIAQRLHEAGGEVCLWDRQAERLEEAVASLGSERVHTAALDIVDADAVGGAAKNLLTTAGRIDILVNSAGITGPNVSVQDYPVDEWRRVVDVDLTGSFLCCRAVIPAMLDQNYGRIVNIASIAGKEGNPNASAYSAAKAGVIGLTKSLGKELSGSGVRVNAVTPAAIRTEIFEQMTEEHIGYMLSKIPMGRFGTVDEAANLCLWLASEDCSFSTGAVFDVSGGRATY